MKTNVSKRGGFTLVELLVVIGIIAMLAALLSPAVMRARAAARNAAIKAEIDMLHMAIMNYKNEYGSFPPCFDANPAAAPNSSGQLVSLAQKHLKRLFPRCSTVSGPAGEFELWPPLVPANAIVAWLGGYTADPTSPIRGAGGRKRLYDFDQSRFGRVSGNPVIYFPSQQPSSPYIYISRDQYEQSWPPLNYVYTTGSSPEIQHTIPANAYRSEPGFNADTFQILYAGRDGLWGTDDDQSNFWKGTRREYLDSLQSQ